MWYSCFNRTELHMSDLNLRDDWVFELKADKSHLKVIWQYASRVSDGYGEHFLIVEDCKKDNADTNNTVQQTEHYGAVEAARAYRIHELQKEYDLPNSLSMVGKNWRDTVKETILDLKRRADSGEYMAQHHNEHFYVQHAEDIIGRYYDVLEIVDELVQEGKLGLNGMILIDYVEQEEAYSRAKTRTGHERFNVSDWGYWACGFCGNSGDPEDDLRPEDVPCVKKD